METSERHGHIIRCHLESQNGHTICEVYRSAERSVQTAIEHYKRDHFLKEYHCTLCPHVSIFVSQARRHALHHAMRSSYSEFLYKLQHDK